MIAADRPSVTAKEVSPQFQIDFDTHGLVLRFDNPTEEGTFVEHALALSAAARSLMRCIAITEEHVCGGDGHIDLRKDTFCEAAVGIEFLSNMAHALLEQSVSARKARRVS